MKSLTKRVRELPTPWFATKYPGLLAHTLVCLYDSYDAHTWRLACACEVRYRLLVGVCYVFERKRIEPCCMSFLAVGPLVARAQVI